MIDINILLTSKNNGIILRMLEFLRGLASFFIVSLECPIKWLSRSIFSAPGSSFFVHSFFDTSEESFFIVNWYLSQDIILVISFSFWSSIILRQHLNSWSIFVSFTVKNWRLLLVLRAVKVVKSRNLSWSWTFL